MSLLRLLTLVAPASLEAAGSPHIFMVLVDDWGWNDVGFHRQQEAEIQTPNIDRLVGEGLRLDRHYVYSWCAPTRSSLQSGRLPVHVSYTSDKAETRNAADPDAGFAGIPRNMTGIASKLRSAGYRTHMTGKWDAGMATWEHTPLGRGYESFLGYFTHANDYWTQEMFGAVPGASSSCTGVDLWEDDGPARGLNGTAYEEELFTNRTLAILDLHDASEPLFLFHAFHIVHVPLQVPEGYEARFAALRNDDERKYAAMVYYMDEQVGRFVDKFKEKRMWQDTLMVLSSDNGGPIYGGPLFGGIHPAASNRPLRGGKLSDWEGGIRVNAFVAGGFLPEARRGQVSESYVHVADWYTTFCHLAGVDPTDARAAAAGLPPVDGVNQWPTLSGALRADARTEIHISENTLIQGRFKLVTGSLEMMENQHPELLPLPLVIMDGSWDGFGPMPGINSLLHIRNCHHGCLFDILADPTESRDLARWDRRQYRELGHQLRARLEELNQGLFKPDRGDIDEAACQQIVVNGGFFGPWVDMPAPNHTVASQYIV